MKGFQILSFLGYYCFARFVPNILSFRCGQKTRAFFCSSLFKKTGRNINVETGAFFGTGEGISIGDNSGIGKNAYISNIGGGGELVIGDNVMMGPDVVILTKEHNHNDISIPMNLQGSYSSRVVIEDDVWIGIRVIILPGITISKGSIVGAGAVVTKNIPEYSIVGGVPARILKSRFNGNQEDMNG